MPPLAFIFLMGRQAKILILDIVNVCLCLSPMIAGSIPPLKVRDLRLDLE